MTATCSCCEETVQGWVTLWSHKDIIICYGCLDYLNGRRMKQIAIHGGLKPLAGYDPYSEFSMLNVPSITTDGLGSPLNITTSPTHSRTGATSFSIWHGTSIQKHT
jgi:hypothetical protein